MNLVIQEDAKGCGIACCAMVCGHSYRQARDQVVEHCWQGSFSHYDLWEYLAMHGFAYQMWYAYERFRLEPTESDGTRCAKRGVWPVTTPFAEMHVLLTRGPEMGHWVAMDEDGEIFDPVRGRGQRIDQYDVMQIVGIWRVK